MCIRQLCLITFVALGFTAISNGLAAAQDWPQWRGPRSDGKGVSVNNALTSPFQVVASWYQPAGPGYSSLAVAGQQVMTICSDGTSDFLVSLNVSDGKERWRQKIGATFQGTQGSEDGASSSPCIVGDKVIAFGPHGDLAAFDTENGNEVWRMNVREALGAKTPLYGFGSSPVRCGDAVFLPLSIAGKGTSGIMVDPRQGEILWRRKGGEVDYQGAYWIESRNELVVVDANHISISDSRTGSEKFRTPHSLRGDMGYPQATPVSDSRVLLTFDRRASLMEIDREKQVFRLLWSSRELRNSYSPPVCHGDAIFGMCGTFLVCVDLKTGQRIWKSREPGARGVSMVNDSLVLFSSNGEIVCANANREAYQETARVQVAERGGYTAPVFAGDRIFVRNTSGIACASISASGGSAIVQNSPEDTSSGAFAEFLESLRNAGNPQELVDQWWNQQQAFPIVEEGSRVHFVFRGDAREVALLGDMTHDRHVPEAMKRVGNTDLFYRTREYQPDGLWHYAFLVDLENVVCDPLNDVRVPALIDMGGNPRATGYDNHKEESVLVMPGCRQPAFLTESASGPKGTVRSLDFESSFRWIPKKPLKVYLPAGYDSLPDSGFPVIYLLGGAEWLDHANIKLALDNLMGSTCEKAIVVFIPYHDGSGDRIGGAGYAKMVWRDVVPLIEKEFRTRAPAIAFGAADDATATIHLAAMDPDRFTGMVVYSPQMDEPDFQSIATIRDFPGRCYLEWSRYEPRIQDENSDYRAAARKLNSILGASASQVRGGETSTGPGWKGWVLQLDRALEFVLPPDR